VLHGHALASCWGGIQTLKSGLMLGVRAATGGSLPSSAISRMVWFFSQRDSDTAKLEHDRIAERVLLESLSDQTELYKHYTDNASFKRFLLETSFDLSWRQVPGSAHLFTQPVLHPQPRHP